MVNKSNSNSQTIWFGFPVYTFTLTNNAFKCYITIITLLTFLFCFCFLFFLF